MLLSRVDNIILFRIYTSLLKVTFNIQYNILIESIDSLSLAWHWTYLNSYIYLISLKEGKIHSISSYLSEVFELISRLSKGGNLVVLAGDFNVSVGNHFLLDNHPLVSKGGRMLNAFLEEDKDFVLQNPKYRVFGWL